MFFEYSYKSSFLFAYILVKNLKENKIANIELSYIKIFFIKYINRFFVKLFFGLPFIIIKINNDLTNLLFNLYKLKFDNFESFIITLFLNISKNVKPDYINNVSELKVINKNKKITFNSNKHFNELMSRMLFSKIRKDINYLKKKCIIGSAQNIQNYINHPTVAVLGENNSLIYINETKSNFTKYKEFHNEIKEFIDNTQANCYYHKGSIDNELKTYFTPPIQAQQNELTFKNPLTDPLIIRNYQNDTLEDVANTLCLGLVANFDSRVLLTKKVSDIGTENFLYYDKNKIDLKTWLTENMVNKDKNTEEVLKNIEYFWKENEEALKSMGLEERLELSKILNVEITDLNNIKEFNFVIAKQLLNKQ